MNYTTQRDVISQTLLRTLDELGLWSATRHLVLMLEGMWKSDYTIYRGNAARNKRVRYYTCILFPHHIITIAITVTTTAVVTIFSSIAAAAKVQ
jgi:hypothetical protein